MPEILRFDDDSDKSPDSRSSGAGGSEPVRVIVKVKTPGYVPAGFRVRTRVDDEFFTAEASESDLSGATRDPQVESVARAQRLDLP
ncbi:hypothetical protein [Pseudarthrobacter sp. H2]|uniref:hypothetical protein n=1 Tax=Pseudarthrobacter sp. H2 TaxID=3418415 RepID=UPI003CF76603